MTDCWTRRTPWEKGCKSIGVVLTVTSRPSAPLSRYPALRMVKGYGKRVAENLNNQIRESPMGTEIYLSSKPYRIGLVGVVHSAMVTVCLCLLDESGSSMETRTLKCISFHLVLHLSTRSSRRK